MIDWVAKRDGRIVPFNATKIADAIFLAAKAVGGEDRRQAEFLAGQVIHLLGQLLPAGSTPQVEQIQDLVEKVLIEHGHARTAKAYILYRNRRTRIRDQKSELMDAVSEVLQEGAAELPVQTTPAAKLRRIALAASEQYTLHSLLPREFALAHQRGAIHIDRLANYSLAVSSLVIRPEALTTCGLRLGSSFLPAAQDLRQLGNLLRQLVLLAQNEMIGELLFAQLDTVYGCLAQASNQQPGPTECQAFVDQLLQDLSIASHLGSPDRMNVAVSIGLEACAQGRCFAHALLRAIARGLPDGSCVLSPQVVVLVSDSSHAADDLPTLAQGVARERGNPSLARVDSGSGPVFASGLHLADGESGVLARTAVNLPRIALEADSSSEFFAGIDNVFSMAVRQLVHRFEVLSGLPDSDLPFLAEESVPAQGDQRQVRQVLQSGQLSLVPVGIPEALQVARLRFGSGVSLDQQELIQLQRQIVEHYRNHYSLPLTLGQTASGPAARRFLVMDQQAFPLAETLWPGQPAYSLAVPSEQFRWGQFVAGEMPEQPRLNVVYAMEFCRRQCPECGAVYGMEVQECPRACSLPLVTLKRNGGYLQYV